MLVFYVNEKSLNLWRWLLIKRREYGAVLPAVMGYLDAMSSWRRALEDADKDDEQAKKSEEMKTLDT